jgi:predicted exporter
VFALLALSQIPVLRAIGLTVALGVLAHVILSLWLATVPAAAEPPSPRPAKPR